MILNNPKTNGYSLGTLLWWPDKPDQISTGWLQGISLTLRGAPRAIFLTKYYRINKRLILTIADETEILCSLDTTLGTGPKSYQLQSESPSNFVAGMVTFYNLTENTELDLTGAQICPKYITFIQELVQQTAVLTLAAVGTDGKISKEVAELTELTIDSSPTINAEGEKEIKLAEITAPVLSVTETDQFLLKTINGSTNATLVFPDNWELAKVGASCVKVGIDSNLSSCPDNDIISQRLNPGNYPISCPLDIAFYDDSNNPTSTFNLKQLVCRRYNTEYDTGSDHGAGLLWDDFSNLHDKLS